MRQLGAAEFDRAVVAIGTGIEASLLSCGVLFDLGIREIWAKAITTPHGRILERLGVGHVVYPERETGQRVAHLISGRLMDYIEFEDGFAIVKMRAPREAHGRTLADVALRRKYGVTVVGVKRPGEGFVYARPETYVNADDLLIVAGDTETVEKFAAESGD